MHLIKIHNNTGRIPDEVKFAIDAVNDFIKNPTRNIMIDEEDYLVARKSYNSDEWILGTNYEDGSSSCVWTQETGWLYREPVNSTDTPVPGGRKEVIADLICAIAP